jgi:hypothetical protein
MHVRMSVQNSRALPRHNGAARGVSVGWEQHYQNCRAVVQQAAPQYMSQDAGNLETLMTSLNRFFFLKSSEPLVSLYNQNSVTTPIQNRTASWMRPSCRLDLYHTKLGTLNHCGNISTGNRDSIKPIAMNYPDIFNVSSLIRHGPHWKRRVH